MPAIVFTSLKAGAGKTTAATILATELAQGGASVTMIDASPNRNVADWAQRPGVPENLTVVGDITQDNIVDRLAEAASRTAFVIVDLEHTVSLMMGYAIGLADFVIIAMQGSKLDAKQAARAMILVRRQERVLRRSIPFAILITRTKPAITPRAERYIEKSFAEAQVPVLRTQLHDREAYRALFSFGGTLEGLAGQGVSNLELAIANARLFAAEVVEQLRPVAEADLSVRSHVPHVIGDP
jgi:chromosome partitioning protein